MSNQTTDQEETLTDQEAGQGVEVVPQSAIEEETIVESESTVPEESAKPDNKAQKSQKEWSDMKAKVNNLEEFKGNLAKALGIEQDEVTEEDVVNKLQERIMALESDSIRKDWEVEHPVVRSEKYKEAWQNVNADPKYSSLSYDERWKLIKAEPDLTTKEDPRSGSIPPASKSIPTSSDDIDPEVMNLLKRQFPRLSEEQIRKMSA